MEFSATCHDMLALSIWPRSRAATNCAALTMTISAFVHGSNSNPLPIGLPDSPGMMRQPPSSQLVPSIVLGPLAEDSVSNLGLIPLFAFL